MNTKLIIAAASALTASAALMAPAAQAHGHGGFGHFFFRAPPVVYAPPMERTYRVHHRIRHVYRVYRYVDKPVDETIVAYVDSHGRQYDFASKVWFDGTSQCWSGKRAFLFKGGSWFYGNAPWQQSGGTWQTTAADAPAPVACETAAAFATKLQPVAVKQAEALKTEAPKTDKVEPAKMSSVTAAVDTTTKIAECKKYFPSVGEMVAVPCSE